MRFLTFLLLLVSALGCRSEQKNPVDSAENPPEASENKEALSAYPASLQEVFEAHGGLELWRSQQTLIFELPKGEVTETHTVDLRSRMDRVDTEAYSMGYDGNATWILDPDQAYEGNPEFYHNLMFYFYAMPFVLADPGIHYEASPDLEFEGVSYPGIRIAYGDGVGTSPEDEYYLHYDPDTYQMAWLGYTVTYHSGTESDDVHWIRYADWESFNGLLLPRAITWHNYEGRDIGKARNTLTFENIRVSELKTDPVRFKKPAEAVYFEQPD